METVTWETLANLDCNLDFVTADFIGELPLPKGLDKVIRADWNKSIENTKASLEAKGTYDKLLVKEANNYPALYGIPKGKTEEQRIKTPDEQGVLIDWAAAEDGSSIDLEFASVFYPYLTAAELPEFHECYEKSKMERPLGGLGIVFLAITKDQQIVTVRRGNTTFKYGLYGPGGNWAYGINPENITQSQITREFGISLEQINSLRFTSLSYDKTGGKKPELTGIAELDVLASKLISGVVDMDTDVKAVVSLGGPSLENLLEILLKRSAPPDLNHKGDWSGKILNSYAAAIAHAGRVLYNDFEQRFQQLKI